jgi:hypothetical protein
MLKPFLTTAALCLSLVATASAQNHDFDYKGATVHRRAFLLPQCVRIATDENGFDWIHDGPCVPSDIAWIDGDQHIHFRPTVTMAQMRRAFTLRLFEESHLPPPEHALAVSDCIRLPSADEPADPWVHAPPCRPEDIGQVDRQGHIALRSNVTMRQLQYGLALAMSEFSGMPRDVEDLAEQGPNLPKQRNPEP